MIDASNKALQPVWELCSKYKCTKTQLALSFLLSYQGISTIIPGIRTPEQANSNSSNLFQLKQEDITLIEGLGSNEFVAVMNLIQKQG